MTPLVAHAGHVLVDGLLYGGPVLALVVALLVVRRMGGLGEPGATAD